MGRLLEVGNPIRSAREPVGEIVVEGGFVGVGPRPEGESPVPGTIRVRTGGTWNLWSPTRASRVEVSAATTAGPAS